jgi:anaerobic ribonucleoside-triphosphate reductase
MMEGKGKLVVPCSVWSRVVGYMRPVQDWNKAKQQEFEGRATFDLGRGSR